MTSPRYAIIGCGDVGRRIVAQLLDAGVQPQSILALTRSNESAQLARKFGIEIAQVDFDELRSMPELSTYTHWFYLVPPQKSGLRDLRSKALLESMHLKPQSIVLISTTGVYGDAGGEWIDERAPTKPQTERGNRRLDMEQRWLRWAQSSSVGLRILRVPGIYAHSRIPIERLQRATPVVRAQECGFTNRIHADDLAAACIAASRYQGNELVFNATDGTPGTISEYLQAAAEVVGLPPLPEISMAEAQSQLSSGMLSYLSESRRINSDKMRRELGLQLRFSDFREGLKH